MASTSHDDQPRRAPAEAEAGGDRSLHGAVSTRRLPRLPPRLLERIEGWGYDRMPDLTGKLYVVTGGTSGIGQVAAHHLASAGAHVIAASPTPPVRTAAARSEFRTPAGQRRVVSRRFSHSAGLKLSVCAISARSPARLAPRGAPPWQRGGAHDGGPAHPRHPGVDAARPGVSGQRARPEALEQFLGKRLPNRLKGVDVGRRGAAGGAKELEEEAHAGGTAREAAARAKEE
jgi:NAD(P)-dependent dehydrogenase (short-subunit alcohol dehydrogenase family)